MPKEGENIAHRSAWYLYPADPPEEPEELAEIADIERFGNDGMNGEQVIIKLEVINKLQSN